MAVDYLVTVPRDTGVAIESFGGDVTVEGVDGETHVKTVSGDGRLASLTRLVGVETLSGNLEMAEVRSEDVLTAETVSGRIDIEGVRAPRLQVKSFGGAVALQGVESRRVEVEMVSGSVSFDGALAADGRYELRSHSGGIFLTVPGGSGLQAGRAVLQRRPAFRHSHTRRPGRPVPPHARPRGREPRDSRDCRRRRRPPETVHRQRRHGDAIRASTMLQPAASRPSGIH